MINSIASIDQIDVCSIWPADGCTNNLKTCNAYEMCKLSCQHECIYSKNTYIRTLSPSITTFGAYPISFNQSGMLYCGTKSSNSDSFGSLSTAQSVGIAMGVILSIIILVILIIYCFKRNKKSVYRPKAKLTNAKTQYYNASAYI
ncbi:Hypothetical_protein [Hexamita inflata]|uniref:Hypothetical_protein n=1 Tax=Hexamita inflata TaxID=28002 RepID=A0AA86PT27_9EUKA|nr:Hypothetical protein HINF_LOCUS30698 [Hexamita inflata]